MDRIVRIVLNLLFRLVLQYAAAIVFGRNASDSNHLFR